MSKKYGKQTLRDIVNKLFVFEMGDSSGVGRCGSTLRMTGKQGSQKSSDYTGLPKNCKFFGIERVVIVRVACANKLMFALQLTITCERRHPESCLL